MYKLQKRQKGRIFKKDFKLNFVPLNLSYFQIFGFYNKIFVLTTKDPSTSLTYSTIFFRFPGTAGTQDS